MKKSLTVKRLLYQVIMKTIQQTLLILWVTNLVVAAPTSGQNLLERRINLQLEQATLKTALNRLEKSAGVRFSYNSRALPLNAIVNVQDRKSTRLNSSHVKISYAVFCLK